MAWHLGSRLDEVHEQLLNLDDSHQKVIKILAKYLPDISDEIRAGLLSSASSDESVLDQHRASLNDARAFFRTLPKP